MKDAATCYAHLRGQQLSILLSWEAVRKAVRIMVLGTPVRCTLVREGAILVAYCPLPALSLDLLCRDLEAAGILRVPSCWVGVAEGGHRARFLPLPDDPDRS